MPLQLLKLSKELLINIDITLLTILIILLFFFYTEPLLKFIVKRLNIQKLQYRVIEFTIFLLFYAFLLPLFLHYVLKIVAVQESSIKWLIIILLVIINYFTYNHIFK